MSNNHDILAEKFDEVWRLLKSESVRGSVIVAAAIHDDILKQILSAHLVPCNDKADYLFDGPNAPIGTMAARIDLAYRTARISSQLRQSLHIVRKLRNDFAHLSSPIDFDDTSVRDRTKHLLDLNRSFIELIWLKFRPVIFEAAGVIGSPDIYKDDVVTDMLEYSGYRQTFEIWASAVAGGLAEIYAETESLKEYKGKPK